MSTYEAWRATFQDADAAAKAAFEQVQGLAKMVDGLQAALGRQVRFGSEAGNPASGAQDKMSTTQQPAALRLADKYEAHGFLGDHRFAKEQWCSQAAVELRRLHAENQDLRTRHYCNTAEIESLQARVQELGEMARENRSKKVIELERRIAEMEEQMAAIGAGGVEPLRKTHAPKDWLAAVPTLSPDFAVHVPPFTSLAQHKLMALLSQGYQVTGYSIERADIADWSPQRGFVTHGGLVGWWRPHTADADQQQEAEHHGQPS